MFVAIVMCGCHYFITGCGEVTFGILWILWIDFELPIKRVSQELVRSQGCLGL